MVFKDYTIFSYVFLMTVLILLTAHGAGLRDNSPNKQVCDSIVYSRTDPRDATVAACHKLVYETKAAKVVAKRQPKSIEIDSCISEFDNAILTAKYALGLLGGSDYHSAESYINAIQENSDRCDYVFENYNKTNPIAKSTKHLKDLAIAGAYLAGLIK